MGLDDKVMDRRQALEKMLRILGGLAAGVVAGGTRLYLPKEAHADDTAYAAVKRETKINYDKLAKEAEKLNEQERYDEVIKLLEPYVRNNKYNGHVLNEIGIAYFQKEKYHLALNYFKKALEKYPNTPDIHYNLGMTYLLLGNPKRAIEELNLHLSDNPNDKTARMWKEEIKNRYIR